MCSAIPRRIAVTGSSCSPGCASAGGLRAAAGFGRGSGAARCEPLRSSAPPCAAAAAVLDEREDVLLRHAAAAAGAVRPVPDRRRARTRSARRPARRTPCRCRRAARGSGVARASWRAGRSRLSSRRPRRRRLLRRGLGRLQPRAAASAARSADRCRRSADLGQLRPDLDGLALLDEDLRHRARRGARHLGVDLVGRDLEQRLVGLDRLALLLQPLR